MTAMRALGGNPAKPFYAIFIPPGLDGVARDWVAGHAHLGTMIVLPGEVLFAESHWADCFANHLGAAWVAEGD